MAVSPHLVVFTGSGISAESGIKTFRASDGLWENHPVEEVATPQAWKRNPQQVLDFYNQRREQIRRAKPNAAHKALASLEQAGFTVNIITQNIDDLHERAGSRNVLHLHGEILKARSSVDERMRYPLPKGGIELGNICDKGSQLRPDVVWFGESVPLFAEACELVSQADFYWLLARRWPSCPPHRYYPISITIPPARWSTRKRIGSARQACWPLIPPLVRAFRRWSIAGSSRVICCFPECFTVPETTLS
ncbi:hypothetical protein HSBAA_08590 [Vreelandella sulfidaeris]|uniref:protein acetyllysine N-acetyltransferase n=1 Tax=Vreelandella sulfidaeris TaxID=115553 RepID=A0A455U2Z8_9GAMM|nr:hypothetical protein HSBAA_08590 [Halomonas sulfidaeris]